MENESYCYIISKIQNESNSCIFQKNKMNHKRLIISKMENESEYQIISQS